MMRARLLANVAAACVVLSAAAPAQAAEEGQQLRHRNWSFYGLFGTFDQGALQRGFQVYSEVCSTCHALPYMAYRNLEAIGFSEDQVSQIAESVQVTDGPDDEGEMFERPGRPSDPFKAPFPNDQAARAANGGALPTPLTLMVKASPGGADYVYSVLTGYGDPPADMQMTEGMFYNTAFPNRQIAMPPPLSEGIVEYADGTEATVAQMAADVTAFLAWTAEPELVERKRIGWKVILFLLVLTGLLFATKRKIWAGVH